jgi:outer membrane protein
VKGFDRDAGGTTAIKNLGRAVLLLMTLVVVDGVRAENILTVYRQAQATSPVLRAARARLEAVHASHDEARSGLLPHLRAAVAVNYNDTTIEGFGKDFDSAAAPAAVFGEKIDKTHGGGSYSVQLVQPLINGQAWSAVESAQERISADQAALAAVEQDLILQVFETYFNLLRAQADERAIRARKKLLAETLARAEADLEVGTGDVIAVHEARAALDAVDASRIRAAHIVRIARRRLERLTHRAVGPIGDLGKFEPRGPEPDRVEPWRQAAVDHQPLLMQARRRLAAAREQIRFERRARWPDVDLNAGYGYNKGLFLPSTERWQARVGLELKFPLYEGGAIAARVRRAEAQAEASHHRLQDLQDQVTLATENAFLLLQNSVSQLAAAAQARDSARLSLEATREGFRLGTRTIVDLLAAIQALEDAERSFYQARYTQVTARARLKAAAGVISVKDVAAVNDLLIQTPAGPDPPPAGEPQTNAAER